MKSKHLLLLLLLAIGLPWAANAQETLTVCDGTATSSYSPIKGSGGSQTEFIYPASLLGDMEGGTITSVKFFSSSTSTTNYSNTVTVFVEEVASSTISASAWQYNQSTATKVYEGTTLTVSNGELVINFDTPFEYNGGNLCFNIWSADNTPSVNYYYLSTSNSCAYDYYITPPVSVPYSTGSYLPKAEFTYTAASGTCEKPATLEYSNLTSSSVDLTWTGGSGSYEVQYKKASDQEWTVAYYDTYHTTRTINNLEPATNYQARVQSLCEGEEIDPETGDHVFIGSGWKAVSFTTPCDAVTTFPWSEDFESYSYGDFTDPCWVNEHISGNGTQIFKVYTYTNGSNSTHQLQLPDMTSGTMTKLRLPLMTLPTSDNYLFSIDVYRVNATSYTGEGIRVYASTDGEIEGATELAFISRNFGTGDGNLIPAESAAGWYTYELPIPFTGTCYIVLRGESKYGSFTYMDNFKVKKILPCVKPSDPTFVSSTTTSATLSWTNGAEGQTAWQIAYSTNPNFNPDEVTPVDVTSNPGTINGLTASNTYYAYVRANCGDLGYSEWSATYCQFATACDVIPALGYTENFDSYTAGNNVLPTCWNYINTTTYSNYQGYPCVYANGSYSTYANSAPNCLYFYSYYSSYSSYDPQPQYAILPEMTGLAGKQVTLMAKGYSSTSTFKIGTMSDPADASTFQQIAEQALTTSYDEYNFIVNQEGKYLAIMIDAANEDRTSNGVYIDDISIDNVPTCLKPSSPMLETPTSRTAHTATLKWTNGEEGQSAWQIAYSTSATFAPAADFTPGENEWLVDADANPYILNGLQANTTYYAYVRANCGAEDGVSAWSRTKATFTTTAATAVPTGLAVDASSITSESATVNWTGVATNDYHQSYEVYYSRLNTLPDPLEIDSLITGITATNYTFNHLDAEKTYYVWVRDNCGNDGLSAWSSRASFTTASRCQTPDGLAESNVTNESATITWNTYGLTEFNLRYGTDGENWNTIERVNTPYTLDRLTASTTYQVQVQATCADAETWSTVLSFTTACDAITDLPWNENFDAYTGSTSASAPTGYPNDELPNCWQFLNRSNSTSNYPQVFISSNSGYPVSGNCLFFKSSSATPLYAVLPAFEEEIAGLQLTFTYRNEGTGTSNGTLIVGYMTDPADATTFTTVLTCEKTTTLTEKDVLFPEAPAGSYIAFMYQGGSSNNYYMSIDNVKVDFIPTCTKPTALECTATTATSATLRWTAGANENAWQICLNGDETNLIMAESNPFTVEGLTAATAYTAKVRAYCSADDQSDWSNEVSFATLCEAISTFPWTENFNSLTAGIPTCWDNSEGTTTTESYKWNYYATGHDGACLRFNSYNNSNNLTNFLKTVSLSLPSDQLMQLSFWYKNPTGGDFSVYISTDGGATHETALATGLTGASTWTELVISLANYAGQEVVIVFKGTSNYGSGDAYIYLDDVTVMEVPSCLMPTDLAVNYTGGTEATISWTSDAEAWNMRVNGVDVNGVITNPYTLTGLELATTYSVEVQANCGEDGTSEWSNAVSFTTDLCLPEDQCEITFELTDSYGDGWNDGAGIRVIDVETNAEIGFMTNEDLDGESGYGYSELNTLTLAVCDGREIQFVWVSGSYDEECSYVVKDANGVEIFSGEDAMTEPVNYTVDCGFITLEKHIIGYASDEEEGSNGNNYYLIASPLADAVVPTTVGGMITDEYGTDVDPTTSTYDLYSFDESEDLEWQNYRAASNFNLVNGQGYLYASKNGTTLTFTGAPYSGDTKEVTLHKTDNEDADFQGWNLVGNPFTVEAYIDRPFYRMDATGARVLAEEQTGAIQLMEGVFVIANRDGEPMNFTTEAPNNDNKGLVLNLSQGRGNTIDRAIVGIGQGHTLPKFMFNPNDTKLYIPQNGKDYAVVRSRVSDEIPVNFLPTEDGYYNISVDVRNMNLRSLVLKDKVRNVSIDLLRTPNYMFKASAYDRADRFVLSFKNGNGIYKEKIVKGANPEDFSFYSNGVFVIDNEGEANLQVIDLNGRVLSSENIYGSTSITVDAAPGIYLLRLTNGDNVKVQKVVVK